MISNIGMVTKGWGYELIWASNNFYCGKILHFESGKEFSMHFHNAKDETWYVQSGKFILTIIDTDTAEYITKMLEKGSVWRNKRLMPHKLHCLESGNIIEVSTADNIEDNYRVAKGDSQK